ncbi:MAG TPA: hypothetical protein VH678_20550 [Xanthobacteraceae bacterium]|jgi:hypothetical protein
MISLLGLLNRSGTRSGLLGNLRPGDRRETAAEMGDLVSQHPLTLMALGAGIAQGGIGRGLQFAVPALNIERQELGRGAMQSGTYTALRAAGLPHGQALAGALHPELLKAIARPWFGRLGSDASAQADSAPTEPSGEIAMDRSTTEKLADPVVFGRNVAAVNSAIGQLATLADAYDRFGKSPNAGVEVPSDQKNGTVNPKALSVQETAFQRQPTVDAVENLFRAGGIDRSQIREWKNDITKANSTAGVKSSLRRAVELLSSRLEKLKTEYQRTSGRAEPELLYPKSALALQNLQSLLAEEKDTTAPAE